MKLSLVGPLNVHVKLVHGSCILPTPRCRAFEIFAAYGLLLAQPSLCHTPHRATWWPHLLQQEPQPQQQRGGGGGGGSSRSSSMLRFTTMVEVMAPIFEADFFRGLVAPTLHNAWSGWGLDFVWCGQWREGRKQGWSGCSAGPDLRSPPAHPPT